MDNKKRLHPFFIISRLASNYKTYLAFIFVFNTDIGYWKYLILAFLILLSLVTSIATYLKTNYEFSSGIFIYDSGVSLKTKKQVPYQNIQNVDTSANMVYQMLGLVSLDINILGETIKLSPISKKEANFIISEINSKTDTEFEIVEASNNQLVSLNFKELSLLSLLKSELIITFFIITAFLDDIADFLKFIFGDKLSKHFKNFVDFEVVNFKSGLILVLLTILLVFVVSYVRMLIKFYNFSLVSKDNELICKYGLFNKVSLVIKKERIQKVVISQNFRYKLLNMKELEITTLTDNVVDLSTKSTVNLIPIANDSFVEKFAKEVLNIDTDYYTNENYELLSKDAKNIIARWSIFYIFALGALISTLIYFIPAFNENLYLSITLGLSLFTVFSLYEYISYKFRVNFEGTLLSDNMIVRKDTVFLNKRVSYLKPVKVGNISRSTHILLRNKNLYSMHINTIGHSGDITIDYLTKDYTEKVYNYLVNREVANE
ncbi:PH domain-containing protein [Gemelliphila palaticanis]|uniref:PH domain-containing protein n=1 Tax=Gemelliphila palaticanis TaxID=81950 RepID=A0ABX2T157_9BACL|nr:PH domain-containing protein [Gemella palaticanis]MBF0715453.1 PH domain-containing protein [Gemella palaticanis]NYS47383.1 PH domain-containing protein [Gemella palaticanis]